MRADRLPRTALAAGIFLLGACTGHEAPKAPPPASADGAALIRGDWTVTDAFASGPTGQADAPAISAPIHLAANDATDLRGGTCAQPAFRTVIMPRSDFFGYRAISGIVEEGVAPLQVVQVSCQGEPFGSYALWTDGTLLTAFQGYYLRLGRAETVAQHPRPAQPSQPAPAAAAVAVTAVAIVATQPAPHQPAPRQPVTVPAAGTGGTVKQVYLASYRNPSSAQAGWQSFMRTAPELSAMAPRTVQVDLGAKGTFYRLFAEAEAIDDAVLCRQLRKLSPDCGARNRGAPE